MYKKIVIALNVVCKKRSKQELLDEQDSKLYVVPKYNYGDIHKVSK